MTQRRKPGISVLIAAQNEEAMVALCIRSFLEFGDELIVVDNGSTDQTKDIVRALEAQHPKKIRFYDVPDLPDLYHNRQYALERSSYQWVVRADADFVAYTDGDYDILRFREYLLSRPRWWRVSVSVPVCNVSGDFWHTGTAHPARRPRTQEEIRYIPPAVTGHRPRVYRRLPFFRFQRVGRWEGVRFNRFYHVLAVRWDRPLWMHCNLKPDLHHLFRSERTNWRELGDFRRYPTLRSYIESVLEKKYGTGDFDEAARLYMEQKVLPFLELYDPERHHPYPSLVLDQMRRNPIYKIDEVDGRRIRRFLGVDVVPAIHTDDGRPE